MDLLIAWLSLRWLARLLRTDDARSAGERMDADMDGFVEGARGCVTTGCGCYVVAMIVISVVYVISDVIGWVTGGR